MIHNRSYYDKKSCILMTCKSGDETTIFKTLPRWFEQISSKSQVIILGQDASSYLYIVVKEICTRHKKTLSVGLDTDADCVILDDDGINTVEELLQSSQANFFIFPAINANPAPYFMDIAACSLSPTNAVIATSTPVHSREFLSSLDPETSLESIECDDIEELDETICPFLNYWSRYDKKCSVIIPVMDRSEDLKASLPQWLSQLYPNKQIVIVDYGSRENIFEITNTIASQYYLEMQCNKYEEGADIIFFRVDNVQHFNISHAYNYAISRIETDVICTVCADSCPRDYYLDLVMNLVDDRSLVQCWWGLHTLTYENWKKLNGHQEFICGWGGEDDDFRRRAQMMGLDLKVIPKELVFQIPQSRETKGINREVTNIRNSSYINMTRFDRYLAEYGYKGNYGCTIGGNEPIKYKSNDDSRILVSCCLYKNITEELPDEVKNFEDVHYVIIDNPSLNDWKNWDTWSEYGETIHNQTYQVFDDSDMEVQSVITKFYKDAVSP